MNGKKLVGNLIGWLKTTEMFYNPKEHLTGKWDMYEYFTEVEGELMHIQEKDLKDKKHQFFLELIPDTFKASCSLPEHILDIKKEGQWEASRQYITFGLDAPSDQGKSTYQFAIDKGFLKLLKKDSSGKIIFFGFFRQTGNTSQ